MSQLHDKLHTALKLWLKLTRFKKKGRTIGDWQVRMTVEELNESLELDDTGITAAMVPQPIRDYYQTYEPYGGNCILDKLDPMDWVFDNPWAKLPLNLRLFLSKSAFQQLRKNHGLTPLTKAEFDNLRDHRDPKSPKYVKPSRW